MFYGQVGPQVLQDGTRNEIRLGKSSEINVGDAHARYQEAVYRGNVFSFCAQAALTFAASLTSTAPVFTLLNPAGSGKNLSLIELALALSAAPAAATVFALVGNVNLQQASPTATTAGTVRNSLLGSGAAAVGQIFTVATLGVAPTVLRALWAITGAAALTPAAMKDEVAGALIVPPGAYACIAASAAASGFPSITWEEIPI